MKLSIVVPSYNEADTIETTLSLVLKADFGIPFDVLVIDDGSSDSTTKILANFCKKHKKVKFVSNARNMGKGYSIRRGFDESNGDIVVIQDADLEYDPAQLKELIKPMLSGKYDVVYGSRFMGECKNQTLVFYAGNRILNVCFNVLYATKLTDIETCYKVIRRQVISRLNLSSTGFEIEGEITSKIVSNGYTILELPITYHAREPEKKKIKVWDGVKTLAIIIKARFNMV